MLLYLTAVSGVMVSLHYCGHELESWSLYSDQSGCDGDTCGDEMDKNDSCCEDEVFIAKVNSDQDVSYVKDLVAKPYISNAVIVDPITVIETLPLQAFISLDGCANAPPDLWQNIPLYKLYSSYTYYG